MAAFETKSLELIPVPYINNKKAVAALKTFEKVAAGPDSSSWRRRFHARKDSTPFNRRRGCGFWARICRWICREWLADTCEQKQVLHALT